MTTEQVVIDDVALRKAIRKGVVAAIWLAILSVIEFIVAVTESSQSWTLWGLLLFVVLKGWIILDAFMHIRALWGDDH